MIVYNGLADSEKDAHGEAKTKGKRTMEATKKRTLNFGKVDFYGTGRRVNLVTIDIELRDTEKGVELSICGAVWNARKTDWITGGQCRETLNCLLHGNPLFDEIYKIWGRYHLNGMHAGTEAQDYYLNGYFAATGEKWEYNRVVEILKAADLYIDNGYRYGSAWLYRPLPENVLTRINEIIERGE